MRSILLMAITAALVSCKTEKKETATPPPVVQEIAKIKAPVAETTTKKDHQVRNISKTDIAPVIDGVANDKAWEHATWYPLDQKWIGEDYSPEDFSGRYKLTWTPEALYLLVEITDDVLFDQYPDPLKLWWDDDCVEIFIDEDNSGGPHQFTHNAFAYHVALDTKNVVDMSPTTKGGALYNDHVLTKKITKGTTTIWEHKINVYNDSYKDDQTNTPVVLSENKKIGFSLAYCDNDKSKERENFIGSAFVPGEDKNQGYIDASTFGTIVLK